MSPAEVHHHRARCELDEIHRQLARMLAVELEMTRRLGAYERRLRAVATAVAALRRA